MSTALKFQPQTDEEIYDLLPDGEYEGYTSAVHHVSKTSGKESIKVTVECYNKAGIPKQMYVYLTPNYQRLLKHFCKAANILESYNKGEVTPEMCDQKKVRVKVGKEESDQYGTKNVVLDFLSGDTKAQEDSQPLIDDEDIPF